MGIYARSIPCLDGAVIKMPADGYIEIGNRSASLLTVSLSYFINDSTRITSTADASPILEDTSKFDSSATSETWFTVDTIGANSTKGITRQLPRGAKVRVTGGAFTALIWS